MLLKNPTKQESQELGTAVVEIARGDASDQAKAYNLGVALINFAGPEVTQQAIATLRDEIKADATAQSDEPIVIEA